MRAYAWTIALYARTHEHLVVLIVALIERQFDLQECRSNIVQLFVGHRDCITA
jgi:hypothetical protein